MTNFLLHSDNYGDAASTEVARSLRDEATGALAAENLAADLYVVVATFEGDDPWQVLEATQNGLDAPSWSRSPRRGVVPVGDGTVGTARGPHAFRSTQEGDAVLVEGRMLVLTRRAFEPLEVTLPATLRAVDGGTVATDVPSPAPGV